MGDIFMTLMRLAAVSIVMTVALEQIFETKLYQSLFGKGIDGRPSRWAPSNFELRPWIASAVGIELAFGFELMAITHILGMAYGDVIGSQYLGAEAAILDYVLTGLILGGGTKSIKKIAKRMAETKQELQATV